MFSPPPSLSKTWWKPKPPSSFISQKRRSNIIWALSSESSWWRSCQDAICSFIPFWKSMVWKIRFNIGTRSSCSMGVPLSGSYLLFPSLIQWVWCSSLGSLMPRREWLWITFGVQLQIFSSFSNSLMLWTSLVVSLFS